MAHTESSGGLPPPPTDGARTPVAGRAVVPEHVLVRRLDDEAVLLNLEREEYFGLDAVGARMWTVLTAVPSLGEAIRILADEYDVDEATLRRDVLALVERLRRDGLVEVHGA